MYAMLSIAPFCVGGQFCLQFLVFGRKKNKKMKEYYCSSRPSTGYSGSSSSSTSSRSSSRLVVVVVVVVVVVIVVVVIIIIKERERQRQREK
ncbi:hypothetical protein ElyMa_005893500 [Elysia marginata]|uniref:Transmembrane protein n=1 Tax=Elysia marginata TaxID=1093978 RepID=A0AAV4G5G0_9GAST|nr:hypothetical protein ElyMa_005893500 [Elysia marginata]